MAAKLAFVFDQILRRNPASKEAGIVASSTSNLRSKPERARRASGRVRSSKFGSSRVIALQSDAHERQQSREPKAVAQIEEEN
jgi:hypothetical protein